jgi:hypothetical protein
MIRIKNWLPTAVTAGTPKSFGLMTDPWESKFPEIGKEALNRK